MTTVSALMTKDPIVIRSSSMPKDVLVIFLESKVSGLPVLNPSGAILGFLNEGALVKILLQQAKTKDVQPIARYENFFTKAPSVLPTDLLPAVIKAMFESPSNRVLVSDSAGKLVGIISPKDVLRLLAPHAC